MILKTDTGIALLKAGSDEKKVNNILLSLFNVERDEQLTLEEICEKNELFLEYCRCLQESKDVDTINLRLSIKVDGTPHEVVLSSFYDLDLTPGVEQLVTNFNPDNYDRIKILIACIYAPFVKQALNLNWRMEKIVCELADAIGQQCEFGDIKSLYDFFLAWKNELSKGLYPSLKHFKRAYRRNLRRQKRGKIRLHLQSTNFLLQSRKHTGVWKTLTFWLNICRTWILLWFCNTTLHLREWLRNMLWKQ